MDSLSFWISIGSAIVMLSNLIGLVVVVYKFSNDPDKLAEKNLAINTASCEEKHKRIDEIIGETKSHLGNIDNTILLVKENDIKHIEGSIREIEKVQTKILTILEYRSIVESEES